MGADFRNILSSATFFFVLFIFYFSFFFFSVIRSYSSQNAFRKLVNIVWWIHSLFSSCWITNASLFEQSHHPSCFNDFKEKYIFPSILLHVSPSFFDPILSHPLLCYAILLNLILSYLIFSCPILSYPIPSYPILSYPILSYPALICTAALCTVLNCFLLFIPLLDLLYSWWNIFTNTFMRSSPIL